MSVQWWVDGKQVSLQEAIDTCENAEKVFGTLPAENGRPRVYAVRIGEDRMRVTMPDAVTACVTMGLGKAANIALADAIMQGVSLEREEAAKAAKRATKKEEA